MERKRLKESRDSALSKLDQKKKTLEKSRLRLVNEIHEIDRSLQEIQAEYDKISNEASLLLNLPTEVTCMIFDLFVASHGLEHPRTAKSKLPEVVISHVCKQWRDVSLNYPKLWTRFFFIMGNIKSSRDAVVRFDTYIKRSGSQNLELALDFRTHQAQQFPPSTEQCKLICMALNQTHRWKIVTLLSDTDLFIHDHFPELITASAPNLEYFAYSPAFSNTRTVSRGPRNPQYADSLNPTLLNGGTPKLSYLLLDCSNFRIPSFSNITTLRIEATGNPNFIYSWKAFIEILSLTSLANLSIVGNIFDSPNRKDEVQIVTMDNLKHLRYCDNVSMTFLLPLLRAPFLETLSIRNSGWGVNDLESTLLGVVPAQSYFFPSLEVLVLIDSSDCAPSSACHIMKLTQNIKSILISHEESEDYFLSGLRDNRAFNTQCWPKLTTFTPNTRYMDDINVIVDFVRSRPQDTLKLRLFDYILSDWKDDFSSGYEAIQENCTIEVLNAEERAKSVLSQPSWPPGVDCPGYAFRYDPFEVQVDI